MLFVYRINGCLLESDCLDDDGARVGFPCEQRLARSFVALLK